MITVNKNGKEYKLNFLEHMLHYGNLESVLKHGLLSHNEAHRKGLIKQDISMSEVMAIRAKKIRNGHSLHDYASLYFVSKNPMLYVRKNIQEEILILRIETDFLQDNTLFVNEGIDKPIVMFTDGNAARGETSFFHDSTQLNRVPFDVLYDGERVEDINEWKRKMQAEVLVYPYVPSSLIFGIICPNQKMLDFVLSLNDDMNIYQQEYVKELIQNKHNVISYQNNLIVTAINRDFYHY